MASRDKHGFTQRQREALPVVLAAATLKAGLEAADVHRSTWYRWMQEEPFAARVKTTRRQATEEALADLRAGCRYAVTSLLGLLASKSEHIRLQASRTVLEFTHRGLEAEELAERMARIEAALAAVEAG